MYGGGPLFIIAFAALINVTHVDGLADDFSNMLIEITGSTGTYFANYTLADSEPGAWASVNVTVPEEEYSLNVLASNATGAEAEQTYPGMVEVAYSPGMAEDFSNLVVLLISPQGDEIPVAHSVVTHEPGNWAILSLARAPEEGESISILISQPVAPQEASEDGGALPPEPDTLPGGSSDEATPENTTAPPAELDDTATVPGQDGTGEEPTIPLPEADGNNQTPENLASIEAPLSASGSYDLDGEEYVGLPGFEIYPGEGGFTATAWIRTSSISDAVIASSGECCDIERYWSIGLSAGGDGAFLLVRLNDGTGEISSAGIADLADGGWHHVSFVRDRAEGTVTGFVDGVPDLSFNDTTGDISDLSEELLIGNANPHQDEWFDGTVSGAATYLRALSAEEIGILSSSPAPMEGDAG